MTINVTFAETNTAFAANFEENIIIMEGGILDIRTDETLTFANGVLSVNTADDVEPDNTLPVTSAAVYAEVGNINALLATI